MEHLGDTYRKLGEYQPGLDALKKAVALKPDDFRHQIRLGNFYGYFSEYDEAMVAYQDALALKPDSAMGWSNLGGTYLKMDNVEEADNAFQRAFDFRVNRLGFLDVGLFVRGDSRGFDDVGFNHVERG